MSFDRETVDANILLDFIIESVANRFIMFRFVELHHLSKNKIDEFIKFIDTQEENSKQNYLEYIPFDFLFLKEMKQNYDELSNNFNQIQRELNQTKEELTQTKQELTKTKEESKQTKDELKQTKKELKQTKDELKLLKDMKKLSHTMMVGGYNKYNQLCEKPNNKYDDYPVIYPTLKSSIDPYLLISFSTYCTHTIQVTRSGKLLGIGNNSDG